MWTRVLTSLVAGPIVLAAAIAGDLWFVALVHGVVALAAWEWAALQGRPRGPGLTLLAAVPAIALPLATAAAQPLMAALLVFAVVAIGISLLPWMAPDNGSPEVGALLILGGLYLGAALAPAIALRSAPDGLTWLLVVIIGTWACDTVAFVVGSRWGTRKLIPLISPQKTVEGTAAGLGAALAVSAAAAIITLETPVRLLGLGAAVGLGAVVGDLLESGLKRRIGVKDSGWIMPGHGGILDRLDSLLLAIPCGYLYILATGG